eukprot:Phypoly_transcript_13827.p1 GENE.Phypoly_transcript_13827~~Phypoly_transcript_13827.p1  ORF type:complete len:237 (+),score=35.97 Phypoly_transcript_13827:225-935(+)
MSIRVENFSHFTQEELCQLGSDIFVKHPPNMNYYAGFHKEFMLRGERGLTEAIDHLLAEKLKAETGWVIIKNEERIGYIGCGPDKSNTWLELAVALRAEHQRQENALEAGELVIKEVLNNPKYQYMKGVAWTVHKDNIGAIRATEKIRKNNSWSGALIENPEGFMPKFTEHRLTFGIPRDRLKNEHLFLRIKLTAGQPHFNTVPPKEAEVFVAQFISIAYLACEGLTYRATKVRNE